mmetsp:Transcript_32184/g.68111  ORF Transcript_32184/g.68111 Transcript_32184/m.68111 type:complete len:202 (+) Transcript_32184:914-1519(+)
MTSMESIRILVMSNPQIEIAYPLLELPREIHRLSLAKSVEYLPQNHIRQGIDASDDIVNLCGEVAVRSRAQVLIESVRSRVVRARQPQLIQGCISDRFLQLAHPRTSVVIVKDADFDARPIIIAVIINVSNHQHRTCLVRRRILAPPFVRIDQELQSRTWGAVGGMGFQMKVSIALEEESNIAFDVLIATAVIVGRFSVEG